MHRSSTAQNRAKLERSLLKNIATPSRSARSTVDPIVKIDYNPQRSFDRTQLTQSPTPFRGHTQAVELLTRSAIESRLAPAYLFYGAEGVGKSLVAKWLIELIYTHHLPPSERAAIGQKLAQGNHPDVLWVMPTYNYQGKLLSATEAIAAGVKRKAPPQIRIEQVREIGRFLARPPLQASRSIVVIADAQTMAEGAANALLKTLEEPGKATMIAISTSRDELLPTIVSRCQQIPFRRLDRATMTEIFTDLDRQDILAQSDILGLAQGSPGAAIEIWERLQAINPELRERALALPSNRRQALELARDIDRDLDTEAQLWLLDYLQYTYWHKYRTPQAILALEFARTQLLAYVQPRLVWECTLMQLDRCG